MSAYSYQPLPSGAIRVLYIIPGDTTRIQAKLEILKLQKGFFRPAYNALSYCWGEATSTHDISIGNAILRVRSNLHRALLRIRQNAYRLPIWVDAICINQEDESEKVKQIRLMPQIYSTAKCVIIWLGEESTCTKPAAELLKRVERVRQVLSDGFKLTPLSPDAQQGIGEMLTSPWFSRLWVFQEAIKARRKFVLCGSYSIDFEALGNAAQYFRANILAQQYLKDKNIDIAITGFVGIKDMEDFQVAMRIGGLYAALDVCRERVCSDPKDRIYAIHGIVPGVDERMKAVAAYRFEPDATVKDLYVPFTVMHMDPEGRTIRTAPGEIKNPSLPSWCPDYHQSRINEPRALDDTNPSAKEYKKLCTADAKAYGQKYCWGPKMPDRLFVHGLVVDEVNHVVPYSWEPVYPDKSWMRAPFGGGIPTALQQSRTYNLEWLSMCTEACRQSLEVLGRVESNSSNESAAQAALWEILSHHSFKPHSTAEEYTKNSKQCYQLLLDEWSTPVTDNLTYWQSFNAFEAVDALCSRRRFFRTAAGCFGLGPARMQARDKICTMRGGGLPFVIRRRSSSSSSRMEYHMIGEAFVYGYTRGGPLLPEALSPRSKRWEYFCLI
jgi:hypothetical protein